MTGHSGFLDPAGPLIGADSTVFWVFAGATFLMVAASVIIAVAETWRMKAVLPLVVFASAALWLPNEPFIDTVLGFQYASDAPATMFIEAGRPIPVSVLGVGAMFFIFTWVLYRMIISGAPLSKIVGVGIIAGVIDWPLEMMAIHFNVFEYYGTDVSQILGLPITSMVQNCFVYLFMASVLVLCAPHMKGWRALLFLPVIPGCYYAMAFICTWPAYLALHLDAPVVVALAAALVSAAMNAYIPISFLRFVRQD
jgi:hypothetical protein